LLKLVRWYWACELLLHYLLLWVHSRTQSRCCPIQTPHGKILYALVLLQFQ
jgi:hypothetical protein